MGFRFRKSMKVAPGVRLNLNKKSVGLSFGKKGLHYSINSSGRKTASVSIPGTGISYTKTMSNNSKTNRQSSQAPLTSDINNKPYKVASSKPIKDTSIPSMVLGILSLITGCCCFGGLLGIIGGALARTSMKNFGRNIFNIIGFVTSCLGIMIASGMLVYGILHPASPSDNQTAKQTTELRTTENPTTETPTTEEATTEEPTTESPTTEAPATEEATTEEATTKEVTTEKPAPPEVTTEKPVKKKTTQEPQEEQVWISRTGSKYHSNSSCSGMKGPSQVSISMAESMGLTPCKKCY